MSASASPTSSDTTSVGPPLLEGGVPPGRLRTTFRALQHRNFQLFFGGQIISLTGTWMQTVAQSWLVYHMTGSSLQLGKVGFFGQIPVFLLAPLPPSRSPVA